jgi:hypothetical protein
MVEHVLALRMVSHKVAHRQSSGRPDARSDSAVHARCPSNAAAVLAPSSRGKVVNGCGVELASGQARQSVVNPEAY